MRHLNRLALLLTALSLLPACSNMAEDKEGPEVTVPADQLPPAVRATFIREAAGNTVKEADKTEDHGKTVYETDVTINGQNTEIKVAEDGTLISKKADNESAEKPKPK